MDRREVCYDNMKLFELLQDVYKIKPYADIN
jgi:hypothetical protein